MDDWHRDVTTATTRTHYLEAGSGDPVILLHGSGPGVSALANWRFAVPVLAEDHRTLAPDLIGFGQTATERPPRVDLDAWVAQVLEFADALGVDRFDVVGNSMGGAIALALGVRHPERVGRIVTMGSLGVSFPITPALDEIWGYSPDLERMREIIRLFAWDQRYAEDEALVRLRYETSLQPSARTPYEAMFEAPRQLAVDAAVIPEADLQRLANPVLLVHGRDDRVVPLETSQRLAELLPDARLAIYPRCGHWVQIERRVEFPALVRAFLSMPLDAAPTGG
jgi:pimeloyl-ACP methyl ester carboxylesterase